MKLAVVFPGIGYHIDKPLLYYSRKIAKENGYEIVDVQYKGFESGIRGNKDKMRAAFETAITQAEEILKDVDFASYEKVLFIAKSVGTAVAGAYAIKHNLETKNIYFTPVDASFKYMDNEGVVFHGDNDPWIDHEIFNQQISNTSHPYHVINNANHSLETGKALVDINNLEFIMTKVEEYIKSL